MAFSGISAQATHLIGGYMSYRFLSVLPNGDLRYRVTLNIYRDCQQSEVPLDDEISLGVYLNDADKNLFNIVTFKLGYQANVDPPGSVDCDFYAQNTCIEYGRYDGTIDLNPYTQGYHLTFVRCCRNTQTNLPDQGGTPYQGQTYYCFIPNTTFNNSSPVFSGVPSPYMCANDTTDFLFSAVDPDGDDLTYKIVQPFQGGQPNQTGAIPTPPQNLSLPINEVDYNAGYNDTRPFGISNGSVSTINANTGLTTFYAPNTGSYVVCVEVTESRDGVVLSTIRMDLQILVLDCPPNDRPSLTASKGEQLRIDAGEQLCFDVSSTDPDDDNVKITGEGIILDGGGDFTGTLATFSSQTGSGSATSEFCWTPDCDHAREEPYIVRFLVEDDGCPPKFNYIDVEIIVDSFEGAKAISGPRVLCKYANGIYSAVGGASSSTYEWKVTEGEIVGDDDKASVEINWTGTGQGELEMREISEHGCVGQWVSYLVDIKESPDLPVISGDDTVCLNASSLFYSVTAFVGGSYQWSIDNATFSNVSGHEVTVGSFNPPSFSLKCVATNSSGCPSDTAELEVFVSEPNPVFTGPVTICPNAEDVQYIAEPNVGSTYAWSVLGGTQVSGGTTNQIGIDWGNFGAGEVSVVETNRHGCVSPLVRLAVDKTYTLIANDVVGLQDVCEFDMGVEYSTLAVNGSVFVWNVIGGSQASGDSAENITVNWGAAGSGIVSMREKAYDLVNDEVCLSNELQYPVTIHPKPDADEIIGNVELCQDSDTFTYTIAGFADSRFEWAIDGDTSGIIGQGTNTIKKFWDTDGTFTLSVLETSDNDCPGEQVDTNILVNPKPVTSPIVGDIIICPEDVLAKRYDVTGFPSSTYTWTVGGANQFVGQGSSVIVVDWEASLPGGTLSVFETSDKGCIGDPVELDIEIDRLAIDMTVVSVGTPDNRMHINWKLADPTTVDEFRIQKRNAGTAAWSTVATVGGNTFSYTENNINTDLNAFDYRIVATNKCGTEIYSDEHREILLVGYQDEDFNINIKFSDYLGWLNGVDNYYVYESINGGPFTLIISGISPNENVLLINDPDQYKKCYRIKADELLDQQTSSWSNEICFFFSPEVFVPNAFTPNADNLNDQFGFKGIAVNEFEIRIYNRWGEKLYESVNINEKWNPVYKNKPVPQGTYMYIINYSDFEDKMYQKSGTINLLR